VVAQVVSVQVLAEAAVVVEILAAMELLDKEIMVALTEATQEAQAVAVLVE
jgi:hypothetical protein